MNLFKLTVPFLIIFVVIISGCIDIELTQKINRDGSSDINISAKSESSIILRTFGKSLEESGLSIDRAITTEEENKITYSWENIYSKEAILSEPLNKTIIDVKKEFNFPFYYTTITLDNSDKGVIEKETSNISEAILSMMNINYNLEVYGEIVDTNGIRLSDKKVRFDLLKNKKYYVKFKDFFLTDLFASFFFVKKGCAPEWKCSEWTECLENIQTRECEVVNDCNNYFFKPKEKQECGIEITTTITYQTTCEQYGRKTICASDESCELYIIDDLHCCMCKKGPISNNGICEEGEYEGLITYCDGSSAAMGRTDDFQSDDCPRSCNDGNSNTADYYNFTSQGCEHYNCHITTTTTTIIRTNLENELEQLGYDVTYVERNEGKWEYGGFWNYVLVVIKKEGLIPEEGNINLNWGWNISQDVNPLAQKYYPNSEVWLTIVFSNCGGRYINCQKSTPELNIGGCSEGHNLPQKYCV